MTIRAWQWISEADNNLRLNEIKSGQKISFVYWKICKNWNEWALYLTFNTFRSWSCRINSFHFLFTVDPPSDLRFKILNENTVQMLWMRPQSRIQGYRIRVTSDTGGCSLKIPVRSCRVWNIMSVIKCKTSLSLTAQTLPAITHRSLHTQAQTCELQWLEK